MESTTPWVEKYRPRCFDDIVLDPLNRRILRNIIAQNRFPNLLLYGPPGTGKTTTIMNLISAYQTAFGQSRRGLMIHLNASDERGIDVIRNQISQFVSSSALFESGTKFVVLDEVDYMTKTAQQGLKHLLASVVGTVRFCLICNYITRIDETLQNEFMKMRFNRLPEAETISFLRTICTAENVAMDDDVLVTIQRQHKSDIRSMINHIQANQVGTERSEVLRDDVWDELTRSVLDGSDKLRDALTEIQTRYALEPRDLVRSYVGYVLRCTPTVVTDKFLRRAEFIMHNEGAPSDYVLPYLETQLLPCLRSCEVSESLPNRTSKRKLH